MFKIKKIYETQFFEKNKKYSSYISCDLIVKKYANVTVHSIEYIQERFRRISLERIVI